MFLTHASQQCGPSPSMARWELKQYLEKNNLHRIPPPNSLTSAEWKTNFQLYILWQRAFSFSTTGGRTKSRDTWEWWDYAILGSNGMDTSGRGGGGMREERIPDWTSNPLSHPKCRTWLNGSINTLLQQWIHVQQWRYCWKQGISACSMARSYKEANWGDQVSSVWGSVKRWLEQEANE
jgi:hypothetical protein